MHLLNRLGPSASRRCPAPRRTVADEQGSAPPGISQSTGDRPHRSRNPSDPQGASSGPLHHRHARRSALEVVAAPFAVEPIVAAAERQHGTHGLTRSMTRHTIMPGQHADRVTTSGPAQPSPQHRTAMADRTSTRGPAARCTRPLNMQSQCNPMRGHATAPNDLIAEVNGSHQTAGDSAHRWPHT